MDWVAVCLGGGMFVEVVVKLVSVLAVVHNKSRYLVCMIA